MRLCLPLPGEDEPEEKKGKLDVMCLQSWVGGDGEGWGAAWQAGIWGEHAGSHLEPFLSPSQHLISDPDVLCPTCLHPLLVKKREAEQSSILCPGFASAMGRS